MLLDSDEDKNKEILIEWIDKDGKFVNIHEVIFDSQTLIFAYTDTIKAKRCEH
jgi:hypothetical protein